MTSCEDLHDACISTASQRVGVIICCCHDTAAPSGSIIFSSLVAAGAQEGCDGPLLAADQTQYLPSRYGMPFLDIHYPCSICKSGAGGQNVAYLKRATCHLGRPTHEQVCPGKSAVQGSYERNHEFLLDTQEGHVHGSDSVWLLHANAAYLQKLCATVQGRAISHRTT